MKKNRKITKCNRMDLGTLGFGPKILPGHWRIQKVKLRTTVLKSSECRSEQVSTRLTVQDSSDRPLADNSKMVTHTGF